MYQLSARAAVTKHLRPGGLNNRNCVSYSGIWKSKIKLLENLVSSENLLLDLQVAILSVFTWQ